MDRYNLRFSRQPQEHGGEDVAGVGLRVIDRALRDAMELNDAFAAIGGLDAPIFVFSVRDRITGSDGPVRAVVVAVQQGADNECNLIRDWELVRLLNSFADRPRSSRVFACNYPALNVADLIESAREYLMSRIVSLDLPFTLPNVESLACLVPGRTADRNGPGDG